MFKTANIRWFQSKGFLAALALVLCLGTWASAQQAPSIARFASEDAVCCVAMTGKIAPNAAGAGFEQWLAQPEIKDALDFLMQQVEEQVRAENPAMAGLTAILPTAVFSQPWVFCIDGLETASPKIKFVMQLGDLEESIRKKMESFLATSEETINDITVNGEPFQSVGSGDRSWEFGIYKNHFLVASDNGGLARLMERFGVTEWKWIDEIKQELPVERSVLSFRINIKEIVEKIGPPEDATGATFKFEEIERIMGVMGFDGEETVSRVSFHCPKNLTGVWKMFDVAPIQKADLKGVSDSVHFLSSIQMNAEVLWNLLLTNEDSRIDVEDFSDEMKEKYAIDFEQEIIRNFGGHIYFYQQLSLLNPTANTMLGVRLKDPQQFQKTLKSLVEAMEDGNEAFGFDVQDTQNGPLYTVVPYDPQMQMTFPGICFQIIENELLVALDDKAIATHMRKASREGGRLTDDPRLGRIFDNSVNGGLGQPIAVVYLDVKTLLETVYSVLPIIFAQFEQMGADVQFDMEMLPPLETVLNGVLPDIVAVYRTDKGFQMIERSTLPGMTVANGLAAAALLPAVQQARSAARRAQSMNNLRQLAIACHNHEAVHLALPPAYRKDKDGKKLLSWRVELLPYLEQADLYEKFHHDEPWDSPHNKALIVEMPDVFRHPALGGLEEGKTVYLGVSGEQSVFLPSSDQKGRKFAEITDGTSNTLLFVEANASRAVYWTQPEDFNVDEIEDLTAGLGGNWPDGRFLGAMCDGSAHSLDASDDLIRKMATINGGETIRDFHD
jgi:hypothetical protein